MLNKDPFVIHPETFSLIQELQKLAELKDFFLVGGTALALQYGHRNSIDIDLFSRNDFVTDDLISVLKNHFDLQVSFQRNSGTLLTFINNIKTDFIRHDYVFLKPPIHEDGISFLSTEDIAAMKLNAIVNSGKRLKDFIDLFFLLEHFCLNEIVSFFEIKYPHMNAVIALKAISYFGDIDPQMDPPKMLTKISISKVQKRIREAILKSHKTF
ncbi:nucleotidyl transferase AbiEii/AbiGii toxin family protein [Dyadobacter arcticus]|uniref:Nucleotidyl transferase AbiEii toxin, Type IV TA system n=1 Tax=Dyadobacter arcticus TaxID=1078754 RepID=A0ABX0UDK0_9BACT|nr:nucleotidyl transferase AbiEii/AbiGii toxin family protein [Dyadobacter arcticus]NIJ51077.1 hypothetical protein [Dyadobacter arcticus]